MLQGQLDEKKHFSGCRKNSHALYGNRSQENCVCEPAVFLIQTASNVDVLEAVEEDITRKA